jgi:hypothetical protein
MVVSKKNLIYKLLSSLLIIFILALPTTLLFKVNIGSQEFSISYLVLLAFLIFTIYYYIMKLQIFSVILKKDILILVILVAYSLVLSLYKGLDIDFLKFIIFFFFAYLTGYKYNYIFTSFKFINLFIKFAIMISLIGILLYHLKIPIFDFKAAGSEFYFMNSDGYYRAMSIFMNPNSFGYFLLFSISLLLVHKKYISSISYIVYISILFYAMYLTSSRSAELSLLFILFIYFISQKLNKRLAYIIIIFTSTFLVTISILLLFNLEYFYFYDVRFEKWNVAFSFLNNLEYFLIGVPIVVHVIKNGISFSDNMFIYLIIEQGFLFLFLFIYLYYRINIKSIRMTLNKDNYNTSYSIYLISIFIPMMLSNYLLLYPSIILTGISMGIISKYKTKVIL